MNKRIYDSKIERPRAQVGIWSHHLYPEGPQALQIPAQFAKLLETRLVKPLEQKQKPNKNISIIYIFSKTCIGFCPHWITMNQLTTLRDERFREICWINFLCHLQRGNAFMFTCSKNMLITRPPQLITKNGHKQNKCVFPSSLFMSRDWVAFMISLTLSTFFNVHGTSVAHNYQPNRVPPDDDRIWTVAKMLSCLAPSRVGFFGYCHDMFRPKGDGGRGEESKEENS